MRSYFLGNFKDFQNLVHIGIALCKINCYNLT